MVKILSIGNSFSQDAHKWLHSIAKADGIEILTKNLYIGGCSLEQHWNNFEICADLYSYEHNGITENMPHFSIQAALNAEDWDIITVQQQSGRAGRYDTYIPYLPKLIENIKNICPNVALWFHETWEYENGSVHPDFPFYENNSDIMYGMIYATSHTITERYGLSLIPSGEAVHDIKKLDEFIPSKGGISIYRDAFHMNFIYGRMLLGYLWYKKLIGISPLNNTFVPEGADKALLKLLQVTADKF